MRIIIIHRSFALVGGAERVITEKANYLSDKGHQVMLVSYEQGQHVVPYQLHPMVQFKDLNCRFFTLSKYSAPLRLYRFILLRKHFKELLRNIVVDYCPDVIVLASDWQFLIDKVLAAAGKVPVIAEFHNAYDFITKKIGNTDNGIKDWVTKCYYKYSLKHFKRCAHLVVLTENDAKHWRMHSNHVSIIPNPLTNYPEVVDDVPKDFGRIICVGRLNAQKRIDRLISAFSMIADKYPEWHVDVFGEGDEKTSLLRQIRNCHLEKRIILHAPTKTIYDEYKKSQFLVLSSAYEGFGLVLIEAMACGLPCVSFDCPSGPSEIIENGVSGLLVKEGDVIDLSSKIEWMIIHEAERNQMAKKSRIVALAYLPSTIMKEWEFFYESVIKCQ